MGSGAAALGVLRVRAAMADRADQEGLERRLDWTSAGCVDLSLRVDMKRSVLVLFVAAACACSPAPPAPADITGTAAKYTVTGRLEPIDMNRVDSVAVEDGKFVAHGVGIAKKDLPADADATKPSGHWSLTTETAKGKNRLITFTQDETLDEFQIEIPGDGDVHYGTLKNKAGNADVMLMAWGADNRCYWGYVTITPK